VPPRAGVPEISRRLSNSPKEDYKRQLYDKLLQWWKENRGKTKWDEKVGKLVVK